MRIARSVVLFMTLGLTGVGCSAEEGVGAGVVVVAVSAEPAVAARLARVELRVYPAAGSTPTPVLTQRVALGGAPASTAGGSPATTFPLSLRVPQHGAGSLRLELLGFDANDATTPPRIERKAFVVLARGESKLVTLVLGEACLDQAQRCADPALTCAFAGPNAGTCVAVEDAPLLPLSSEPNPSGRLPEDLTPTGMATTGPHDAARPAATLDAALPLDPHAADGSPFDAGQALDPRAEGSPAPVLTPELLPICPVPDACPDPDYPCIPSSDQQGYACRGLYADWPMPNAEPGAKQPPRYRIDAERGVVHDEVTGLLWQREVPSSYRGCTVQTDAGVGAGCTWEQAGQYCSQLSLADVRWRLPSKVELESLVDATQPDGQSLIDPLAFPRTPRVEFWTISKGIRQNLADRFMVSFGGGAATTKPVSQLFHARCVHSERSPNAPPTDRYQIDAQAETVRDPYTDLTWRASLTPVVATLDEARAACASLPGGLRVPTFKELLTLADVTRVPAALPDFPSTPIETVLWSTTSLHGLAIAYAPLVGLLVPINDQTSGRYQTQVRCVR